MYRGLCVLCPGDKPLFQEPGRFLSVPETPTVSFGKHPRTPEVAVADYVSTSQQYPWLIIMQNS